MRDLLDLDRYPLDRLDTPEAQALITRCRMQLEESGATNLDSLMTSDAAAAAANEIQPIMDRESFRHARWHNIYFADKPELSADHPALVKCETINHTVCADQIADSAVLRIYEWTPLLHFLEAVLEKPRLHLMADPLARANVMAYGANEALNWHFDRSEFTVTLLLREPEAGGVFQYRPALRCDDDPNYDGVAKLLRGEDDTVINMPFTPGTLSIFKGKNTAHRVTPVEGATSRMIAVFSFYEMENVNFSENERVGFYGRAA